MALTGVLFLAGCGSLPKPAAMTPARMAIQNRSSKSVKVVVEGEPKIEKLIAVKNQDLAQAVEMAIEHSGLFAKVDKTTAEGFLLEVAVVGYTPPRNGFNMTATMTTRWKLTRIPGQQAVFEDFFKKTHTCTVGDAFAGMARFRKANEGVVRDTIAEGLNRISKENL